MVRNYLNLTNVILISYLREQKLNTQTNTHTQTHTHTQTRTHKHTQTSQEHSVNHKVVVLKEWLMNIFFFSEQGNKMLLRFPFLDNKKYSYIKKSNSIKQYFKKRSIHLMRTQIFSEKLAFLTLCYAYVCVYIRGVINISFWENFASDLNGWFPV